MRGNEVHSIQCEGGRLLGLGGKMQLERIHDMSKTRVPTGSADIRVAVWPREGGSSESTYNANSDPDITTCIHANYVAPDQQYGERMQIEAATLSVGPTCIIEVVDLKMTLTKDAGNADFVFVGADVTLLGCVTRSVGFPWCLHDPTCITTNSHAY